MRVTIVENTRSTQHGQVGIALHEAGAAIDLIKPREGDALPKGVDTDALIVFGGEQDANDDAGFPYLAPLARLMRAYGEADRAVLGICLGAQIMARAWGGENRLRAAREYGWCEVETTEAAASDPLFAALPRQFPIYQMHSDTFTLPQGATRLARSSAAENQAFRVGRASYGMQFHFEANRNVAAAWNRDFPDVIESMRPGWLKDMPHEAARLGAQADAHGLALARAWVAQIQRS